MQVAKWGNSLAVRLPRAVVEALKLKEGDDLGIQVVGSRSFEVEKARYQRLALFDLRRPTDGELSAKARCVARRHQRPSAR